jgi:hypothetical protein
LILAFAEAIGEILSESSASRLSDLEAEIFSTCSRGGFDCSPKSLLSRAGEGLQKLRDHSSPRGTTADMILRASNSSPTAAGQYEIYDIGNNSLLAAYQVGQVGTSWAFVTIGASSVATPPVYTKIAASL